MNIYLDIDGTLLQDGAPAPCSHEFIEHVTKYHDCYWLTTHVRNGELGYLFPYLERAGVKPATLKLMECIKTTQWDMLKTEAIDMNENFLWFDDQPTAVESDILSTEGKDASLVLIGSNGTSLCAWLKERDKR